MTSAATAISNVEPVTQAGDRRSMSCYLKSVSRFGRFPFE
jgi:hypothetical protein